MAAAVTSVEQLCNAALARAGWRERIGSIYEGTAHSILALELYGQTRDALLREKDWGFPRRDIALTPLKVAPPGGYVPGRTPWVPAKNPPQPYLFEYAYPSDCLMVRAIQRPTLFMPNFTPYPCVFEIANDTVPVQGQQNPPGRVILCFTANAVATYVGQVTDMTQWDSGFTEALIAGLSERFAPALGSATPAQDADEKTGIAIAETTADSMIARQG